MSNHRRVWEADEQVTAVGLPQVPAPKPDDPEDVAWALSTSEAMWSRGEHSDAIRWLRKAADSASEADHDLRAVELAKAAAELATMLRQESAPNVEAILEKEVSAELRDVRGVIPPVPPSSATAAGGSPGASKTAVRASTPPPGRVVGTVDAPKPKPSGPPGPPPRTLKVTSSQTSMNAVSAVAASNAQQTAKPPSVAPAAPKVPSFPPPAPPTATRSEPPETARAEAVHHDNPTRPRQRALTPTELVHVPHRGANPDATSQLSIGRELRARVEELAEEPEPTVKPSRPPPPPPGESIAVKPSQAVHVIVWRDASGVHVAPAGTVVSSITVDAMLVALDPGADLSAWLEGQKAR